MPIDNGPDSSAMPSLDWADEALVLFLLGIRNGDRLPLNVITDKDPFTIEPWVAPAGTWFLCHNEDSGCADGQIIRVMGSGYWKEIENDTQISCNILEEGRKVFWEFYLGRESSGERTGWQMLEYHIERKVHEADGKQVCDFNSLCRIYLKEFDRPVLGDASPHSNANQNAVDRMFLATQFRVPTLEEQETKLGAGRNEKETGPDNNYNIHREGFLELKDFEDDCGSASSSSDDSSHSSGTSDGCFDSEALLLELGYGSDISSKSREANTCYSPGANEVSVEAPSTASSQGSGYDLLEEGMPSGSAPTERCWAETSTASSSRYPSSNKSGPSCSGKSKMGRLKRASSRISEGSRSSHTSRGSSAGDASPHGSGRTSSVGKIKRLGKKYFCLNSF